MTMRGVSYLVLFVIGLYILTREKPIPPSEQVRIVPMSPDDFTYESSDDIAAVG